MGILDVGLYLAYIQAKYNSILEKHVRPRFSVLCICCIYVYMLYMGLICLYMARPSYADLVYAQLGNDAMPGMLQCQA